MGGNFKRMTNSISTGLQGVYSAKEWKGCSIKGSPLSAWHTVGFNVKERKREKWNRSQLWARGPLSSCCLFWLLLPVLNLSTLHRRTLPSLLPVATGEESVGVCAWAHGSGYFKSMWEHLQCTPYNHVLSSYRKRPFRHTWTILLKPKPMGYLAMSNKFHTL